MARELMDRNLNFMGICIFMVEKVAPEMSKGQALALLSVRKIHP